MSVDNENDCLVFLHDAVGQSGDAPGEQVAGISAEGTRKADEPVLSLLQLLGVDEEDEVGTDLKVAVDLEQSGFVQVYLDEGILVDADIGVDGERA